MAKRRNPLLFRHRALISYVTNGMLVNGKRITSNTELGIKVNDTLQFGNFEFLVTFLMQVWEWSRE